MSRPRCGATTLGARAFLFVLLGALAILAALPSIALADSRIGGGAGFGAGQLAEPWGVAVSEKEGGAIYVADVEAQRIDEFSAAGAFIRAFGWGTVDGAAELQTCTALGGCQKGLEGSLPGEFEFPEELAVDNSCAEHEPPLTESTTPKCSEFDPSYGDVYVVDGFNHRVQKFDPTAPEVKWELMLGGEVNKTKTAQFNEPGDPHGITAAEEDVCTAAEASAGDACGIGVYGAGAGHFHSGWGSLGRNSIAVGPDGTLYVGDLGRVEEFNPVGVFAGELAFSDSEPQYTSALAVDKLGDIFERSAIAGEDGHVPGVREYGPAPTRELLGTLDSGPGGEPAHIALDGAGDLFVSDPHSGEFRFLAFRPSGALYTEFTSDQVEVPTIGDQPSSIAVGNGDLYAIAQKIAQKSEPSHVAVVPLPVGGPPRIEEEHATDLEPTTATLHAVVNPEQFDTEYRFEWITQADYEADGDQFGAGTEHTAFQDLGSISRRDPVQAPVSGLTLGTVYRWRAFATSPYNGHSEVAGSVEALETLPSVSLSGLTTQRVAPEEVTLKAGLNPNNSPGATHYRFVLCSDTACLTPIGETEGTIAAGGHSITSAEAAFPGLRPSTEYHYELLATDSYGHVESAVQAFTTEPSPAEEHEAELRECPNVALREENGSTALPDCRAYEQVSPVYKAGYPTGQGDQLAPSGERVEFASPGDFGDAGGNEFISEYLAHRTGSGWTTQAVLGRPAGAGYQPEAVLAFTPELDRWLFFESPGAAGEVAHQGASADLYMGSIDGSFLRASPTFRPLENEQVGIDPFSNSAFGDASDFSRLFFATDRRLLAEDPLPDHYQTSNWDRIYALSGVGGPDPVLRLAAEVPPNLPPGSTGNECGINPLTKGQATVNTSADGSVLFYSAPIELFEGAMCGMDGPNPIAVYVRVGENPPVRLSAKIAADCHSPSPCATAASANAVYDGTDAAGDLAWFTTTQPLTDSDTDAGNDLYLARLEGGQVSELIQVSAGEAAPGHPTPGQGAEVKGVVALSRDGSHIYFVAAGALSAEPDPSTGEVAVQGADNLYAYDSRTGVVKFVARLCSGPQRSGSVQDAACPSDLTEAAGGGGGGASGRRSDQALWAALNNGTQQVDLTPDGRYLLFKSFGRLTAGDTDSAPDIYRYDFQTGDLTRVSFGRNGNDANGNDDAFPAEIGTLNPNPAPEEIAGDGSRSISDDGSTVVFETKAPLVSADTNGATDVYEWEEQGHGTCTAPGGCVSLVSDGVDPHGTQGGVLSASGRDITFYSQRGLVPADTDGLGDIYDAREGGGFPYVPPPKIPCQEGSAEACHGESTKEELHPAYTTENLQSGGNGPQELKCAKGRHKVTRHGEVRCVPGHHHHHHKKHRRRRAARANRGGQK